MASEAPTDAERKSEEFRAALQEEDVDIPRTSGMAMMLQRIIGTFRARFEGDAVGRKAGRERTDR